MSSSIPLQIAETIQTASLNRAPDPEHDLNPSTAASSKQPVELSHSDPSLSKYAYDDEVGIDSDGEDEEDIPYSVLKPVPRRKSFGPLPDLRFEQSYLASIAEAKSNWGVAFITMRDQVGFSIYHQTYISSNRSRSFFPSSKAQYGPLLYSAGDTGTHQHNYQASQ
jgi:hypothetical protein